MFSVNFPNMSLFPMVPPMGNPAYSPTIGVPPSDINHLGKHFLVVILWSFNIAVEICPFIDHNKTYELPIKNGECPPRYLKIPRE